MNNICERSFDKLKPDFIEQASDKLMPPKTVELIKTHINGIFKLQKITASQTSLVLMEKEPPKRAVQQRVLGLLRTVTVCR
jgi:hypothetical protein